MRTLHTSLLIWTILSQGHFAFAAKSSASSCASKVLESLYLQKTEKLLDENRLKFLTTEASFTKDWNRLFVRNPRSPIADPHYLQNYVRNATDSMFNVFEPWFLSKSTVKYEKMMHEMRFVSMVGSKNKDAVQKIIRSPDHSHAGYEQMMALREIPGIYTGYYQKESGMFSDVLQTHFRNVYSTGNHLAIGFEKPKIRNWLKTQKIRFAREGSLHIPDIDKIAQPTNAFETTREVRSINAITHVYPPAATVPLYAKKCETMMESIRESYSALSAPVLTEKLAEYYYYGINAHLYVRVNNSILMSQVNYLLMKKGIPGISHGYWDELACVTNLAEFKRLFAKEVLK